MRKLHARFFDLARLKQQLDADSELPLRQLRQRDHALGQKIPATDPVSQTLCWLTLLEAERPDQHPNHLEGWLLFLLTAFGFGLGVLAMTGILFANQQQPVNVLLFLGAFVGLQLLMLVVTVFGAYLPLTGATLHSPLGFINPASWAIKKTLRQYSHSMPWQQVPQLTRLLVLRWGQLFAISFNVALLLSFWFALLVSDRNFGWSSTLNIDPSTLRQLVSWLASPWSWWLEEASVSTELVSDTRFQGLQNDFATEQVAAMRAWWPFLLCALFTYGLLPRLLLYIVFNWQFRLQLNNTLVHYPGVKLVLDRLQAPVVDSQAAARDEQPVLDKTDNPNYSAHIQGTAWLLNWSGALANDGEQVTHKFGVQAGKTLGAGINLGADEQALVQINAAAPDTLLIAVKSWEPPLAELADFIAAVNKQTQCVLLLIPLKTTIAEAEWQDWLHFVRKQVTRPMQLLRADEDTLS